MKRFLQPLWVLLTTSKDSDLQQMIEYLKEENRILRSKLPERIIVTPRERSRLVKFGSRLGGTIRELISIVSYRTFCRWRAANGPVREKRKVNSRKPGRPRTREEIRELILRIARENGWGSTRVLGELKKLGITSIGRTTVAEILREAGLDPGPKRGEGSWDDFVRRHAATLWAADFLTVRSMTLSGVVDLHLLFFIHIGSRRVILSSPTANPDSIWVTQQARNVSMEMEELGLTASHLVIDHDTKFTRSFREVFRADETILHRVGPRKPNMNAYAERFVQTIRQECLDHFVVCGDKHLEYLVREFVTHYHEERPHQSLGNVPICDADAGQPRILKFPTGEVGCRERLGGLLKHYFREAG